ncbi:hypothetical protein C8Q77DRAFT_756223 [Trametes polyzona]|nr:hypothetical protein C8Q77DRAFT_756223 [Trametes polyzona]
MMDIRLTLPRLSGIVYLGKTRIYHRSALQNGTPDEYGLTTSYYCRYRPATGVKGYVVSRSSVAMLHCRVSIVSQFSDDVLGRFLFFQCTCLHYVFLSRTVDRSLVQRIVSSGSFACDIVTDSILTTSLVLHLLRSRTGFKRTDNVIESLVLYTVNTGLVTSVVSVLVFVFSLSSPHSFVYGAISIVSNKIYVNTVMAVLNSRRGLATSMGFELDTSGVASAEVREPKLATSGGATPMVNSWFAPRRRISVSLGDVSEGHTDSMPSDGENHEGFTIITEPAKVYEKV